jgi:rubrerythrin
MVVEVEIADGGEARLVAGSKAKGEYRCIDCGYGVTVYRELPSCPMCGSDVWEQLDWSPLSRAGSPAARG